MCPVGAMAASATAYFYDHYPVAPLEHGSPYAFGAMSSTSFATGDCCFALGLTTVPVAGAMAIQITNNNVVHLHLVEIQVC